MDSEYRVLYFSLLEENRQLKNEIKELKGKLGLSLNPQQELFTDAKTPSSNVSEVTSALSMRSGQEDKLAFFMSLFKGREDVYARRWNSEKTGKSGYSPICANEWKRDICRKSSGGCKDCKNRDFVPITQEVIFSHLNKDNPKVNETIGIYPLTLDDCCYFTALDFDDDNWEKDITAFRDSCIIQEIPVAIERSRSGNGGHAWIFFSEKISAVLARRLASGLLTMTMNSRHELRLTSYDRIFPNQDFMPKGGLGNLIALPLFGPLREQGKCVFLDETMQPHKDQWAYLSGIKRLSLEEVEHHVASLSKQYGELGFLSDETKENNAKSEVKSKRPSSAISKNNFPETVHIVQSNRLYIEKAGITQAALNQIKRLAAFRNSDFYDAQRMRLPTYNKPRIIDCSQEDISYISIPRGCLLSLSSLLKEAGVSYEITDHRNTGTSLQVEFSGNLDEDQATAEEALLNHETGVLSAPPGFGKTVVAASIIGKQKINTLVLVHTKPILTQWKEALNNFLSFHEEIPELPKTRRRKKVQSHIGQLGGQKNTLTGRVDVATIQSFINRDHEVLECIKDYGMLIVDECHHGSAFTFEQVLNAATAKYIYGLTATPKRKDGQHPIMFMQCGLLRYKVDVKAQAAKQDFDHFFTFRFTGFQRPLHIPEDDLNINQVYNTLIEDDARNRLIIGDIIKALQTGRSPLVLSQRTEHVKVLVEALSPHCKNVVILTGEASAKEKRESLERLQTIQKDEQLVIVATGKYIGEGFDYPRLDTLFLAMPISWAGTLQQYAGRLHRDYKGKDHVIIYDYVDINIRMMERMYFQRIKGYHSLGYQLIDDNGTIEKTDILFDSNSYVSNFSADIRRAKKSITVASPWLSKIQINILLESLSIALENGCPAVILTRPVNEYKSQKQQAIVSLQMESLKKLGCTVLERPKLNQKFAVIDGELIWYGSVNLLGSNRPEESVMRFENKEIAAELVGRV